LNAFLTALLRGAVGFTLLLAVAGSPSRPVRGSDGAEPNEAEEANGDRSLGIRESVHSLAFSPDGKRLAAVHVHEETVTIWNLDTGKKIGSLDGRKQLALAVAFSPDGKWLATGGNDGTFTLWDTETWQEKTTSDAHRSPVSALAFLSDGSLVTSERGGVVVRWDVSGDVPRKLASKDFDDVVHFAGGQPTAMAVASDSTKIAVGADGVLIWDIQRDKLIEIPRGKDDSYMHSLAFLPDGESLIGGCNDIVFLWDTKTGKEKHKYEFERSSGVLALLGGDFFAMKSRIRGRSGLAVFRLDTGEPVHMFKLPLGSIRMLCTSPLRDTLAIGIRSHDMRFDKIELRSLKPIEKLRRLH
jgi:WD40 repeat protein